MLACAKLTAKMFEFIIKRNICSIVVKIKNFFYFFYFKIQNIKMRSYYTSDLKG